MKRTERLLHIMERLRASRSSITAQAIAEEFEITERTVYRDMKLLMEQGIPISGEAGVGYMLDGEFNAPALQFTPDELEILAIGLRLVFRDGDNPMQRAAESTLSKIQAGLKTLGDFDAIDLYATGQPHEYNGTFLTQSRQAIRNRKVIELDYCSIAGELTTRRVKPISLLFFHNATLLAGFCELRQDFRNFRVDLIERLDETSDSFNNEHYKLRKAFLDAIRNLDNQH